jgi:mRNA-degrading endonuclease toxin of MazEF toxin-antitoxin module
VPKPLGLPRACVVNLDTITTIPRELLAARLAVLRPRKLAALDRALRFALGLV